MGLGREATKVGGGDLARVVKGGQRHQALKARDAHDPSQRSTPALLSVLVAITLADDARDLRLQPSEVPASVAKAQRIVAVCIEPRL